MASEGTSCKTSRASTGTVAKASPIHCSNFSAASKKPTWSATSRRFQGTFYDGTTYQAMNFGIIDEWTLKDDAQVLEIRFAPQ